MRAPAPTITGPRVYLRPPQRSDAAAFVAAVRASRQAHGRWTSAPATRERFVSFVDRFKRGTAPATHASYLMLTRDDEIAGIFNFSEIVRGVFLSTYLGYYGFSPWIGHGYMREGMALALDVAFRQLKLHRVEVNIQPANLRSVALAERTGFTREGYSRRYVKLGGRWRDHLRFAMLAEDWRTLRKQRS
ncbi:MAG: GNAT family N-acetyltransferase [Betaproteobacteria bacterium]